MVGKRLQALGYSGYNYPGVGEAGAARFSLSQAVVVPPGKHVWVTGQVGWKDDFDVVTSSLEDQYMQAFENVALSLAGAGSSWEYVFKVESFHVETDQGLMAADFGEALGKCVEKYLGDNRPGWTAVGIKLLTDPAIKMEIQVWAAVPE
jgi:enamine deaminase RidA (YjgF/YER057c/UK114 family)